MKRRSLLKTLAATFATVLSLSPAMTSGAAATAGGSYQVEIIVFQVVNPSGDEDLSAPAEGRGFSGVYQSADPPPKVLKTLTAGQLQMGGLASRLRNSGNYRVIAHAGWIQTATAWNRHSGLPLAMAGVDVPGLAGSVYLERGQLLHLGFNLTYDNNNGHTYTLSELRRIKFNEKHYFDHPAFGVIALVNPASAAAAADADAQ
ncbi:MAG: CsiV family protein [Steroidobacteraceae bacterium]|jgi:hypothetical protein